jgi:diguanylate cyclase (GGDEF)-like protein
LAAEAMREAVLELQVLHDGSAVERFVTISVGVATVCPSADDAPTSLITAADEALYRAKGQGRNRVETQHSSVLLSSSLA